MLLKVTNLLSLRIHQLSPVKFSHCCRRYWTAQTYKSKSPEALVEKVKDELNRIKDSSAVGLHSKILYTISKHLPPELLLSLVEGFQKLEPALETIGCLGEDDSVDFYGVSMARWLGPTDLAVTFISDFKSRPSISLGREISAVPSAIANEDLYNTNELKFKSVDQMLAHGQSCTSGVLDLGGKISPELQSILPERIKSLIFFSAPSPEPLLNYLSTAYPKASLMGIIASSTTFKTGRRTTIIRGNSIKGDQGAVGIAVLKSPGELNVPPVVEYENMKSFGPPKLLTGANGNIIFTLDSVNAMQCLLKEINNLPDFKLEPEKSGQSSKGANNILSKEKKIYLGFLDQGSNKVIEFCQMVGGSPSRGTIAIERMQELETNQWVQFFHRPQAPNSLASTFEPKNSQIEFRCCDSTEKYSLTGTLDQEVVIVKNLFLCASEFGIIPAQRQIINIPYTRAILKL
ncbi:hypothetical protein PPACK8108_LOCUS14620 [Phakopsora pachyrhizi]|uniref:FIST domain-containing protein n=1 Tax=Phakopsora pachyrhizi TaxID=170000 RepID=A0AAV0B7B4_PHAPC|nr:hypothetical protein PPACK8108_LOCUS14620 [Phakopsora pachyrhizi]